MKGVPRMWGDGDAGDMTGRSIAGWGIVDGVGLAIVDGVGLALG
jgi:hypothetical protein